ncbi:MAG TPA: hypothetical protein VFW51_03025 [Actinomycetota bacterium]|nr:hypothetical protein [Actinomycetota bacterium]
MEADERIRATPEAPRPAAPAREHDEPATSAETPGAVTNERCVHHPSRAAVARCSACEEPICLPCAVPVRGRVIGPECLAAELGDPQLTVPPETVTAVPGSMAAVAGAVVAVVATIGPWTRTGASDRLLGAWVPSIRWSMIAALSAVALLVAAWWFRARGTRTLATLVIVGGAAVVSGSALAIAFPPTFQEASWGPWLGAAGGAIAAAGAIASILAERRPRQGV